MRATTVLATSGLLLFSAFAIGAKKDRIFFPTSQGPVQPRVADIPANPAIEKLIAELGSEDWRTREKAGRELAAQGDLALPHLRKAILETDDAEIQRRLVILVRKLDYIRLVEPKRITLSAKNKSPKELFEAIAKQTGYRIQVNSEGIEGKHSVDFENVTFWQAMDALSTMTGYTVYTGGDDQTISVGQSDEMNPHVAYSGPFRLLATNINSNRSVQLSGISRRGDNQRTNEYLNLSFIIHSEPKNPMLGIAYTELTEAKDELGGSLLPPQEPGFHRVDFYGIGSRSFNNYTSVNLTRADRAATTIKTLKGRVGIVLLSGSMIDVGIPDVMKVKKKSFTGRLTEIAFDSLEEDATEKGVYTATFTAKRLGQYDPDRDGYQWVNSIWQRVELIDANGNRYTNYGPVTHNFNGQGTVELAIQFGPENRFGDGKRDAKLGKPAKFVLNEWLSVTHEMKFEFKNIPLP